MSKTNSKSNTTHFLHWQVEVNTLLQPGMFPLWCLPSCGVGDLQGFDLHLHGRNLRGCGAQGSLKLAG